MPIEVRPLTGSDIAATLEDLAALRIKVFREWPYLYDGDHDYERRYLAGYAKDPNAVLVGAFDGSQIVGAATGMPLLAHGDAQNMVLPATAPARDRIYYCAESVLLPAYRGQGIGHRFFDIREEIAREGNYTTSLFAAVIRPPDHPLRPADYRPLDGFWRKRGYAPLDGAALSIAWKDIDLPNETEKPFCIWSRSL